MVADQVHFTTTQSRILVEHGLSAFDPKSASRSPHALTALLLSVWI